MFYIDLNSNYSRENQDVKANVNLTSRIPDTPKKLAVSKLDLCVKIPVMRVEINQPQSFSTATAAADGNITGFDTKYQIKLHYKRYGVAKQTLTETVRFVNSEKTRDDALKIAHRSISGGDEIDNFDDYFNIDSVNILLNCVNNTIIKALKNTLTTPFSTYAEQIADTFKTNNTDTLNIYLLNQQQNSGETEISRVMNPNLMNTWSINNAFCIGYSKELYDLLFCNIPYIINDGFYYPSDISLAGYNDIIEIPYYNDPSKKFTLINLQNKYYYDTIRTYNSIVLTTNIGVFPLTINAVMPDYNVNKVNIESSTSNLMVLNRYQINNQVECTRRLTYSNNNLLTCYNSITNFNVQNISVDVYLIDKYGFLSQLKFKNDSDYLYVQLAAFN